MLNWVASGLVGKETVATRELRTALLHLTHQQSPADLLTFILSFPSICIMLSKCCREVNLFAGPLQMAEEFLWRHRRRQQISVAGSRRGLGLPAMLSSLPVGKKQHYTDKHVALGHTFPH